MSHTPGPWRYLPSIGRVLGPESNTVADCRFKNGIVDGVLISAAPDLLDACKAALGAFENNNCIDWDDLTRAIAKAEGR